MKRPVSTRFKPVNEIDAIAILLDPYFLRRASGMNQGARKRRNAAARVKAVEIIRCLDAFRRAGAP